jgi:DNA-binding SARP family transcriptional activator
VIGEFAILHGNTSLSRAGIGSRKARMLLALLAVDRGTHPAERIADALWSTAAPQKPEHNVATMVSRLRRVLGGDSIVGDRAGYRLGDSFRVDLHDAAVLTDYVAAVLADGEPAQAMLAARRALHILERGRVLDGEPEWFWAEPARVVHGTLLRRARRYLADAALRLGDIHAAQTTAENALLADGLDEAACRLLMRAYHAAGEPGRAIGVFDRLRGLLDDELGVYPAAETSELYVTILRAEGSAAALMQRGAADVRE